MSEIYELIESVKRTESTIKSLLAANAEKDKLIEELFKIGFEKNREIDRLRNALRLNIEKHTETLKFYKKKYGSG